MSGFVPICQYCTLLTPVIPYPLHGFFDNENNNVMVVKNLIFEIALIDWC